MKKEWIMINLLFRKDGNKKADYLKKKKVFYRMGDNCYYHPWKIPTEPFLISMGNNVVIASNVTLITHDIISHVFSNLDDHSKYKTHFGKIEIGNNVFIGANSKIIYNTKIGNNVIISAGSVVHGKIPDNSIVSGNPAKIIGKTGELIQKRKQSMVPSKSDGTEKLIKYFWENH